MSTILDYFKDKLKEKGVTSGNIAKSTMIFAGLSGVWMSSL